MRLNAIVFFLSLFCCSSAQTVEQLGGTYFAYPAPSEAPEVEVPDGYTPVYVSHYGRHGSRWITDDYRYLDVLALVDSIYCKDGLTPLGEDVRCRLQRVADDAVGRSGHLTGRGEAQHHDIAQRMAQRLTPLFADSSAVNAVASTKVRCIMSMAAFCEGLKELNPGLQVSRSAYDKDMSYIAYTSPEGKAFSAETAPWRKEYDAFVDSIVEPKRFVSAIVKYPDSLSDSTQFKMMMDIYWIACSMQDVDIVENFYDLFTYEELYSIWRTINARMYVCNGPSPLSGGVMKHCADGLLKRIIDEADNALSKHNVVADLRFGHDTNLLRLLTLIEAEGCTQEETDINLYHKAWKDYELSPMAANIQFEFYSNGSDILVAVLLNERPLSLPALGSGPIYSWSMLRSYLLSKIS